MSRKPMKPWVKTLIVLGGLLVAFTLIFRLMGVPLLVAAIITAVILILKLLARLF